MKRNKTEKELETIFMVENLEKVENVHSMNLLKNRKRELQKKNAGMFC